MIAWSQEIDRRPIMVAAVGVVALVALIVAACGGGALPASDLSTMPPATSTAPPNTVEPVLPADLVETESVGQPTGDAGTQGADVGLQLPNTGDSWEGATTNLVGLESTCGNVSYVSSNPAQAQVIVGVSSQGLFELDDETGMWNALGLGSGSAIVDNRTSWIEFDPLVPERFWEAGAVGHGLFRTEDNGATFSQVGDVRDLDFVSVDLSDPFRAVMMVGVHEQSVIYRSDDAGVTWQDLSAALPADVGFTPYPVVFTPSIHLLGTYRSDMAGIFHSRDAGATWTRTFDGAISGPPVVRDNEVFWLLENGGGVVRSSNRGFSFEAGEPTGGTPSTLTVLSDGRLVTHNAESLLISDDLGASWTPFGPPLLYDPTGVAVSEDANAVFVWRFSCNSAEEGNAVEPLSILRLEADFEQS